MLLAQSSNPAQVQTGTITGRLLALDGAPAGGVRVSAMPAGDPAKPSATTSADGTVLASLTQTDASGRYRLENVPPGRYYVLAGFVDSPTYFPGVTTTITATAVSVASRATVSGIDFQAARLSTGLNLKGRLKRDSNEGVSGLNIFLSGSDQYPNTRSLPDGSFEFLKLKPGSYTISVSTPNFPPRQVVLTDKDISNLDFVIPWTVDVTGNVSVEGGGMRPNLTLTFAGGARGISSTNARDNFRITLPEGAYAVAANGLPSGFFIKSIKSGSTDLLSEPLKLSRTSAPAPIAVTLGVSTPTPWVKLSGRVTGLPNSSTAATRLTLNGPVTETLQATLDVDGSFEFPKLLPGNYSINITPTSLSLPQPSIIVPNYDLAGVLISFPAAKEITGRISVEDDGPLPFTNLILTGTFGVSVDSGQPTLAQLLVATSQPRNSMNVNLNIQKDGTFKASLPEGQYRISATPQFRNANGSMYAVKAFTYGTTDLTRDSVSVTATDSASLILTFGPTSTIAWSKVTGRVTGPDSSFFAANPLTVALGGSGLVTNWTSTVKPDGSFEFPKLYPGTYTARIAQPFAPPSNTQTPGSNGSLNFGVATALINVTGADITGLEIAIPRQKNVTGRVTLEGRGLMPRFMIPLAAPASTSSPQVQYMNFNPQPDGSFTVSILEGTRQVGVATNLPAGYTLKSMMYGTTDVLKNPLKVAMSDTAELRVTLTTPNLAPVRVSGKLAGVDDSIFSRGPITATVSGTGNTAALTVPVRPDRSFEFPEVFPGNYSVRVTGGGILNSPNVPVTVVNTDITNIEIAVPRQKEVAGRVILDGLAPMPRFQISTIPSAPTVGLVNSSTAMFINPQTDGTYRLTLLVGEHPTGPAVGLPVGYTIKSFTYGAADLLTTPLKVGDTDTDELRITITTPIRPPVQVRGHVSGLDASAFAKGTMTVTMASGTYVSALSAPVMADGTFEFPDVFPGSFSARVIGPGILNAPSVPVIVAGTNTPIVEIAVPRQKEITGHVVLEGSGPMPRLIIPLMSTTAGPGVGSALVQGQIPILTAGLGIGVIGAPGLVQQAPGLATGPANSITINPQTDGTFRVTLLEGEQRVGPAVGLPPGYALKSLTYGSVDLLKNTLKIASADTDELRVVISTSNPTPVRVRGRVIGLDAASFARGSVNAMLSSSTYFITLNAVVAADGTFEFANVFPGSYLLRAVGPSVLSSPNLTVTVANTDVGNLEIRVPSLKDITGHVTIEGGGPYPLFAIPLASLAPVIGAPGASGTLPTIRPAADGTFHIGLPAGEIRISNLVGLPPGYTVKSFSYGSTDLLKNPLKIAATDMLELQISLVNTSTPVNISGRVDGVDLNALAKTPVRVTMTSPSFMVPLTVDVRPDGTFEFSKVYPGNYRILAEAGPSQPQRIPVPVIVGEKEITGLVVTIPK
jgi:hypothetical protein